jgi:integrative and conjugative element protein (TIGR02256 family)
VGSLYDILIYQLALHGRLKIATKPLYTMLSFQQHTPSALEAGGLLIGRYLLDCDDVIVDQITIPMDGDVRERCFFKKNTISHQRILESIWEQSKGTANYIGEWHTHPERIPNPSGHDFDQWRKVLRETKTDQSAIIFMIIGTAQIRIWQGMRRSLKFTELFAE